MARNLFYTPCKSSMACSHYYSCSWFTCHCIDGERKIFSHYLERFFHSSRPPPLRFHGVSLVSFISHNFFMMSSGATVVTCPRTGRPRLRHPNKVLASLARNIAAATMTCPRTILLVRFGTLIVRFRKCIFFFFVECSLICFSQILDLMVNQYEIQVCACILLS